MISETDWALPLKALSESTKKLMYGYFGEEPKVSTVAAKKATEE